MSISLIYIKCIASFHVAIILLLLFLKKKNVLIELQLRKF